MKVNMEQTASKVESANASACASMTRASIFCTPSRPIAPQLLDSARKSTVVTRATRLAAMNASVPGPVPMSRTWSDACAPTSRRASFA